MMGEPRLSGRLYQLWSAVSRCPISVFYGRDGSQVHEEGVP